MEGKPIEKYRIQLSPPWSSGEEWEYVKEALEKNELSVYGEAIDLFKKSLATITRSPYVVLTNTGTSAIDLALNLLKINRGDRVLCSTSTYAASAFPIIRAGAKPIFIDSDPNHWNMDPGILADALRDTIKKGKKPKAVIAVHSYGMPFQAHEIINLLNEFEVDLIEDAAEAFGSIYHDKPAGSLGRYGILSFNGNKIVTTGGGGAITMNTKEEALLAEKLASQSKEDLPWFEHEIPGNNWQMGNINACIGLGQLRRMTHSIKRRRAIYQLYCKNLPLFGSQMEPDGGQSNRWLSCFLAPDEKVRNNIIHKLNEESIESRPVWKPMHLQPVFSGCEKYVDGTSEDLFKRGFCLPSGSNLNDSDIEMISEIVNSAI